MTNTSSSCSSKFIACASNVCANDIVVVDETRNTDSDLPTTQNPSTDVDNTTPSSIKPMNSEVWKYFDREVLENGCINATCKHCSRSFNGKTSLGTTHLKVDKYDKYVHFAVSTAASESSFSSGGRLITESRTSLSSDIVEALSCVKDWLPSNKC